MNNVIDADSLLYRASHIACCKDNELEEAMAIEIDGDEEDIELCDSTSNEVTTALNMVRIFHSMLNEIVKEVDSKYTIDKHVIVLTVKSKLECCKDMSDNFRYGVMQEVDDDAVKGYKHNRKGMDVPEGLNDLYEYVHGLENTVCISGIEADDYCVRKGLEGHIVSALDKDVIYSVPLAYNYNKFEYVENTPEEIRLWFWTQVIVGDGGDGIRGIYRVGAKGAEKMLANIADLTDFEVWKLIVTKYYEKGQTLDEAIATARCVSMTQWTEENGLVLWTPPTKGDK
jgi:hypothetical protein